MPPPGDSEDQLRVEELRPVGGTWSGLLFDNPRIGLPPQVTWTFEFDFEDVIRDFGGSPVSATVDWVPLEVPGPLAMAGATVVSNNFADPIESSVYFFDHHRFDTARLLLKQQMREVLLVEATIAGDIDGLGIDELHLSGSLAFDGIIVHLSDRPGSIAEAERRLTDFLDVSELRGSATDLNYRFELIG